MAELLFFGTCAGTEPQENSHHCSLAIRSNGAYYWFDAGENCSYTAHLMGADLLGVKAIFLSHTHMDHIGGLGNLLWNIRKLTEVTGRNVPEGRIRVIFPVLECWEHLLSLLRFTEGGFQCGFSLDVSQTRDGVVYDDGTVRVTAHHNLHCQTRENGEFTSYSYKIEVEGKSVVFSGDVQHIEELDALIGQGCDHLLMETGHHKVEDVCRYATRMGVGKLWFVHNGRELLNHREEAQKTIAALRPEAVICTDGLRAEL